MGTVLRALGVYLILLLLVHSITGEKGSLTATIVAGCAAVLVTFPEDGRR